MESRFVNNLIYHKMNSIVLQASKESVLSKQQQEFNRLVKKIDNTKKSLVKLNKLLDESLSEYHQKIVPIENALF